eukprot:TRINITY_DN4660_c0_g1_i4.p2 TRINITY_DN4660_c0_g1~~TRINITY_DN4660_c0_g1_i4.p2  ORF type:complete len:177 (-),score=26.44 TRINITY_DN4660_c0_g1_i4:766-1296(-)
MLRKFEAAVREQDPSPQEQADVELIERRFWRGLRFSHPLYGSDIPGTLFDASAGSWNLNALDSLLSQLCLGIAGVTSPYLYAGSGMSAFAWHVEDTNLYSINYLHFGHPKTWYFVPADQGQRFESIARLYFPQHAAACPEYLRHKTLILSPTLLHKHNISMSRGVHVWPRAIYLCR